LEQDTGCYHSRMVYHGRKRMLSVRLLGQTLYAN